jgi:hypothetical protein
MSEHPTSFSGLFPKKQEAAPVQEPVFCGACNGSGWVVRDPDIGTDQECFVCDGTGVSDDTTPPAAQRQWVGLTKTVVGNHLRRHALGDQSTFRQGFKEGVAFAEMKLKEKNT